MLEAVAGRYRAALIDEFQDTDPLQWRILERAFAGTEPGHLLVMVGDPKQAIYRFRGGELATYRQAGSTANDRFGLTDNRRSSADLVAGLNALMQPGLVRSDLEVPAVQAKANKGELLLPAEEPPLQLLPVEPAELESRVAALCQGLLERRLVLRQRDQQRVLQPGDLCLLVGRHSQAESLRAALERRQLPSRLVSRGDVFESLGATALQRLLDALANPGDPGRQRLLAASALLGWSAAELKGSPPERWDQLGASSAAGRSNCRGWGSPACSPSCSAPKGWHGSPCGGGPWRICNKRPSWCRSRCTARGSAPWPQPIGCATCGCRKSAIPR